MSYAYTIKQGIVYFKRLKFMLCVLKKKNDLSCVLPHGLKSQGSGGSVLG